MNNITPKERILTLMRQIYSEFSGVEVAEAIGQIRKEIEAQASQQLLSEKIAELQKQLDQIA